LNVGQNGGPCAIWAHCADSVLIQYCEAYNNRTNGAADGGAFDFDGGVSNSVIQYCYSHDNDGAGYLMWNYEQAPHKLNNNTIRYSLSVNDGRKHSYAGFHLGTSGLPITNIYIYNNTVITSAAVTGLPRGIWTGGSTPNEHIYFYNNLIVTDGKAPLAEIEQSEKDIVFNGNAYWCSGNKFLLKYSTKTYTSFGEWRKAEKQEESTGVFADPKLTWLSSEKPAGNLRNLKQLKAFRLQKTSPLRQKGINLNDLHMQVPSQDMWGNTIPLNQKPDIGAYQFPVKQ
ncbi:MAG: right-handed parallel beta-helix repeat-containing protein, partial [Chitinophagaceae bacterium]|nr:right-handed parallel beta-helix repeat-containing protein [Chitinophagaceae bacterium]